MAHDDIKKAIDRYFAWCKGQMSYITNKSGEAVPQIGKNGETIYVDAQQPTHTGLALTLGWLSAEEMMTWIKKNEPSEAEKEGPTQAELAKRAKVRLVQIGCAKVINAAEVALFAASGTANGAARYLAANDASRYGAKPETQGSGSITVTLRVVDGFKEAIKQLKE